MPTMSALGFFTFRRRECLIYRCGKKMPLSGALLSWLFICWRIHARLFATKYAFQRYSFCLCFRLLRYVAMTFPALLRRVIFAPARWAIFDIHDDYLRRFQHLSSRCFACRRQHSLRKRFHFTLDITLFEADIDFTGRRRAYSPPSLFFTAMPFVDDCLLTNFLFGVDDNFRHIHVSRWSLTYIYLYYRAEPLSI